MASSLYVSSDCSTPIREEEYPEGVRQRENRKIHQKLVGVYIQIIYSDALTYVIWLCGGSFDLVLCSGPFDLCCRRFEFQQHA